MEHNTSSYFQITVYFKLTREEKCAQVRAKAGAVLEVRSHGVPFVIVGGFVTAKGKQEYFEDTGED